ncbi:formate dehydrogenase subunit gamma [Bordetella genomosp. 1]|uniref:Formate dehydrogenase subunit gamma n=1 Tax=Bordetella genomosp. 1 TaxID=1395607 RepID=A0A261RVL1_9BORD|nr:formate dehydrogenase subunit gamma [Bordetella genomosp. 1]MDQ8032837.1 formate dehydrogenase subunit gamma [Bordetella sp.]OZI29109.1 formate dehydrogenase subunit gamma [Bordetella genomosp. 1]OZI65154.1 formate dehydrogenase subunit gamma [Bordetella genomosp. 1]
MAHPPAKADLASSAGARGGDLARDRAAQATPAIAAAARLTAEHQHEPGALLPILHAIQDELGCIPPETVQTIAEMLNLSRAEVHGVISFYPHFRTEPAARHVVQLCRAEACQAMGADALAGHARGRLGCDFHQHSADGEVTLEPVYCLGLCAQSPAMLIDGQPHARVTPARFDALLARTLKEPA